MWGPDVDNHRGAWEIVRRADHPRIGLILDSYHTLGHGTDPESIHRIPREKILFVQLADAPAICMDLFYLSRHFRCMPGKRYLVVPALPSARISVNTDSDLDICPDTEKTAFSSMPDLRLTLQP